MAIVSMFILLTVTVLLLPGMFESKELRNRYYLSKEKPESFISALKSTLKQRSFVIYIILAFGFNVTTGCLTGSIPYAVSYVLKGSEFDIILLFASFLNGAIVSVPIWVMIAKRMRNNKKMAVIGGFLLTIGTFLTAFYVGVIDSMVYMVILGFTMGNFWALMSVYFSDVLDERIVLTKSDIRGATVGVQNFFGRLSRGAQIAIFAIAHEFTGFVEGSPTQTPLAELGIRFHMSIIPAIILLICTIIYWKKFPLTNEKIGEIKKQMQELGFLSV